MNSRQFLMLAMMTVMLTAVGCKKSNDNTQSSARATGRAATAPVTSATSASGTQTTYVVADSNSSSAFQANIKNLVSAQLDPQYLGYVSPTSGVLLRAYVEVNTSGQVVTNTSRMTMEIYDEYTNQVDSSGNRIPPVTMTLPAVSGYGYNGQFQITFQDSFGRIEMYGNFNNGGALTGQVFFANYRNFDGTASSASSLTGLGSFQVGTCGFFKCY